MFYFLCAVGDTNQRIEKLKTLSWREVEKHAVVANVRGLLGYLQRLMMMLMSLIRMVTAKT